MAHNLDKLKTTKKKVKPDESIYCAWSLLYFSAIFIHMVFTKH